MKIGIFGGCFNPPHNMHKKIATKLINNGYLDNIIFIPTGNNYIKNGLISVDHRIKMINLMIDNKNMSVSDISKDKKYYYTYEVLDYFKKKYKDSDIYFICGTDNLNEFYTWKNYEYILASYKLIVIVRNDNNIKNIIKKYSKYKNRIIIANISQNNIASSIIRKYIKEDNINYIYECLDRNVLEYIQNNNLYKN